jgi:hypothetical protein
MYALRTTSTKRMPNELAAARLRGVAEMVEHEANTIES